VDKLRMDIRYAFRTLAKSPAFALIAILVLSLGIAATTAIFSVVNAVLIRPLPYGNPARLVALSSLYERGGVSRAVATVSLHEVEQWRAESHSLESVGSFVFSALPVSVNSHAMFLVAIGADPELLDTLGVRPAMGRNLPGSGSKVKDSSVVISHRLWAGAFHADPQTVGRTFLMDGRAVEVIGVLPAWFQFPRSDASYFPDEPDIVYPVANIADSWGRDSTQWFAVGRLKPGASAAQSESELRTVTARAAESNPSLRGMSVRVSALDAETTRSVRPALLLTLGIAMVLLLIACTNIMNLLFSRAVERGREMAVRQAVGATAGRLVRQMLTESACLTFLSGAVGVVLAGLTVDSLVAVSPAHLPISGRVGIDWTVLAFAFLVCATASIAAGVFPALYRSRQALALIASGSRSSGSRAILRVQHGLMVTEIALGVGLLAAAGLLAHSLFHLSSVDPGFRTQGTVGFEVAFAGGRAEETPRLYERILDATRAVPGVISAGWITSLPPETRGGVFIPFSIAGAPADSHRMCNLQVASEDYFGVAGVALARGRDFTAADATGSLQVAIVNETLARQYFPNADPLGQRIVTMFDGANQRQIVGIIRDMHDHGLSAKPMATVFVPYRQFSMPYGSVVARTGGSAEALLPEIRRHLALAEPDVPIKNLTTIDTRLRQTLDAPRFYAAIAIACASMATLFVTLGLYGVISHGVARRTYEIGIRMALGAPREEILRSVLWQGLQMAAIGIALGMALSLAGTRLLSTLLFEIKPIDPATLASAAITVIVVALAASYVPAYRASQVQPIVALRHE
jgi:putative ABC transport system permease protein